MKREESREFSLFFTEERAQVRNYTGRIFQVYKVHACAHSSENVFLPDALSCVSRPTPSFPLSDHQAFLTAGLLGGHRLSPLDVASGDLS